MNKLVKEVVMLSALAAVLTGASMTTLADEERPHMWMMGGGPGYGPGMMGGGYGPGPGYSAGYGPAMMGGYGGGYGPGMMGGYGGYGMMGPWMMGGMGPGTMGGYGGYGMMGPGMMSGNYGMGVMGPWMMAGLSDAQWSKLEKIQLDAAKKQFELMRQMVDEQQKLYNSDRRDSAAIDKAYEKLSSLQRQMLDLNTDIQKKAEALLTDEQKAKLRRGYGWGMMGY